MSDPLARPALDLAAAVQAIRAHDVTWVLSGSLVLVSYGAKIEANDLDLVPERSPQNLERICGLLRDVDAVPGHFPDWSGSLSLEECRSWRPEPTVTALDHLFVTDVGMIDVPPSITGTYEALMSRATRRRLGAERVWMCDPREVLARLPSPPRAKDVDRAAEYGRVRALLDRARG